MVKLLFLLIASLTFAEDWITAYRNDGIDRIERFLDAQLTKRSYWQKQLESLDTRFGYFENTRALLFCDKKDSRLQFFRQDEKGKFIGQKSFNAYTGRANGDKHKEGDLRTPIGVYRLTRKLDKVDPFYGPMAYVTSYPNFYDRIRGKNGSGIWIHGLPADAKRDPYTRGCIAIDNGNLQCLDRSLDFQEALLVIDEEFKPTTQKNDLVAILAELYRWRHAWIYNNFDAYIGYYGTDFRRSGKMDYDAFKRYKRRVFAHNEKREIRFKNIAVMPYPGLEPSLFVIYFDEYYDSERHHFEGRKGLIVRLRDKRIEIVAEE